MKFTVQNPNIEIEFHDEIGTSSQPAMLEVKRDGEIYATVQAVIERKKGADGGWYNCVVFKRIK